MQPVQNTTAVPRKQAIPRACLSPSRAIQNDPASNSPLETSPSNELGMAIPIKFNVSRPTAPLPTQFPPRPLSSPKCYWMLHILKNPLRSHSRVSPWLRLRVASSRRGQLWSRQVAPRDAYPARPEAGWQCSRSSKRSSHSRFQRHGWCLAPTPVSAIETELLILWIHFRDSAISPTRKTGILIRLATDATTNSIETPGLREMRLKSRQKAPHDSRSSIHPGRPTNRTPRRAIGKSRAEL